MFLMFIILFLPFLIHTLIKIGFTTDRKAIKYFGLNANKTRK